MLLVESNGFFGNNQTKETSFWSRIVYRVNWLESVDVDVSWTVKESSCPPSQTSVMDRRDEMDQFEIKPWVECASCRVVLVKIYTHQYSNCPFQYHPGKGEIGNSLNTVDTLRSMNSHVMHPPCREWLLGSESSCTHPMLTLPDEQAHLISNRKFKYFTNKTNQQWNLEGMK